MKLSHFSYLVFTFLIPISTLVGQTNEYYFEDAYMKCYKDAYTDEGKALFEFFEKSEKSLSEANILKGTSSENYMYFLNNSAKYISVEYKNLGYFNFAMKQLREKNFDIKVFKACTNDLEKKESYQSSKINRVEKIFEQIETATNVQDITRKVAKVLTSKDLEHIYYRLRILNFLELHGSKNIKPPNLKEELSETELKNALQIHIKAQDEILVNTKMVSFGELLSEAKKYIQKNTSEAIILIKSEEHISKQFSAAIKNEITKMITMLRDETALKNYNRSYDELTEKEQQEIKKIYSDTIIRS